IAAHEGGDPEAAGDCSTLRHRDQTAASSLMDDPCEEHPMALQLLAERTNSIARGRGLAPPNRARRRTKKPPPRTAGPRSAIGSAKSPARGTGRHPAACLLGPQLGLGLIPILLVRPLRPAPLAPLLERPLGDLLVRHLHVGVGRRWGGYDSGHAVPP